MIQTFVSLEVSEETQIKGRTARQGNQGSFSMMLIESELEKIGLPPAAVTRLLNAGDYYDGINAARRRTFDAQYQELVRDVESIKRDHEESRDAITRLFAGDFPAVKQFLEQRNCSNLVFQTPEITKTICMMDATGSMSACLEKAKRTVKTMFERTFAILKEKNVQASFAMQFGVYRNYSSGADEILEYSSFESDPASLRVFMDKMSPSGGQGNEAIEIGLAHAYAEVVSSKANQIILIGDMPPNTQSNVTSNREGHGEAYWRQHQKFATPTFYRTEVAKIAAKRVPIHAFYIKGEAKDAFEEIAAATGGQCNALDIESTSGADVLTNLVTVEVLKKIGDMNGGIGSQLAAAYFEKFSSGYVRD